MEHLESRIREAMQDDDWQQVADLEPLLDEATPPVSIVSAALWYAEQGLKVFPLQPGLKLPYKTSHGFKDASNSSDHVRWLWDYYGENSNVGIATGHHIDVIDIDGPEGATSWAHLKGVPEPLGVVRTPRGRHIYIPATGRGNKAGIAPGIDYRGLGGYVVAPPSVNETGVAYRWTRPLTLKVTEG